MSSHKRIISRSRPTDAGENEFKALSDLIPHPPSRPPLNTIQVPNRNPTEIFDETANNGGGGGGSRPNTPKSGRGKAPSESGSAQSTPARVVSRVYSGGSAIRRPPPYFRGGTGSKAQREVGIANCGASVEVSHFELNEDPSFWRDHNVQVLIRIRPINSTESSLQEHSRCLKQESSQTLMWIGHPETRFTFDHVACETISQEKLFEVAGLPMVENCMSGYNSCMFAYGQTGSGKTYTMMGEIQEINEISEGRGMTPRIFEYLFSRIREEEENRKDEKLKYSCKCSFLEIYNEQITDLLEPSSTNLQLREDLKKGVYVENLMEHEVATVKDVLEILIRGTANRKIAATHMNSESSRSHSVFTCVIESQWEKDSMTHLRYGRLNLVDLAGSERQKSSGAEGERLKEAANINKSLSTLGLVIMTLVDVAHGKQRHIPYRDSRLTFLLQDSLGGNSKTTIIANVSPSICSANETLSTLKFAQRAKLIQNNAKVNEDASGNVIALQQQIQQLKKMFIYQIKNLEAILIGALRREKKMETSVRRLEDEIEHTNHLVCQREDDAQRIKDLSWIHEEKTKQLKMLTDGLVSGDSFLKEENDVLLQEIQLLQARINGNPELTRLSLENMRLNEELKMFQEFYQLGERETLLAEISELRQQVLHLMFEEVQKRLCLITEENVELKSAVATKEAEISALAEKWEKATIDLTSFLSDGCQSLEEASDQIEIIIKSFPQMALIDEHIKRVVQVFIGNEKIIADLQNKLENAQKMGCEMKKQLSALKEATLVFSDVQQLENDENTKELLQLRALLREKGSIICDLESKLKLSCQFSNARFVTEEKMKHADRLLLKFEEAQETMKEADVVLTTLLDVNMRAKHNRDVWKRASEVLEAEKASLLEVVQSLQITILQSFLQIQMNVEKEMKAMHSEITSLGKDFLNCVGALKIWLEDIASNMMEKGFVLFVLHLCHMGLNIMMNSSSLKRELARKDVLLKGLLFDFRLLQELTSNAKDKKDETLGMMDALSQVHQELDHKTSQVDDILVQQRQLQIQLTDKEAEFNMIKSDLERANSKIDMLADENNELRHLLEDLYVTKRDLNENLEEKQTVIEGLEKEILCLSSSVEEKLFSTVEGIEDEMRKVSHEKDNLRDELVSLNANLDMAKTLADEKEAIAVEARQVAEASKLYAEQKEEEVKILERSIEELEYTIDVLEKKVKIKQYKDHIFELVLHSEAQASQFQQKYKALEAMVSEVNTDPSTSNPAISTMDKTEKSSMRTRGSSSPFKCIASLVQQMTSEKDQELSVARHQIEELEAVSASRQKEVCALTARLATVESMTHDVIRDLLGVKMDMTNYAVS
ncbi:Kinesin-like protein KIN12B [Acorus gramineus]|uniref:Kinesin-like protein KIN12B n=1 Tax=Acorus gramineus TaxID=55184 RepID=A0AAV9BZ42_ACOGR|nr:Kinesin-like protein KIN12B [Acorus gramineus]